MCPVSDGDYEKFSIKEMSDVILLRDRKGTFSSPMFKCADV